MRYLIYSILAGILHSGCVGNKTKKINFENCEAIAGDSSVWYDDNMLKKIPPGFIVDTTEKHFGDFVAVPVITEEGYKEIENGLQKEILEQIDLNRNVQTDSGNNKKEKSEEVLNCNNTIGPLSIYKNENLISYGFQEFLDCKGQMRPFRSYFSVNYDTHKKRFIYFDDYFRVSGASDSAALKCLILGDIGDPDLANIALGNWICFSADKENVYFYFDQFGLMDNPMGIIKGIKRKYLDKFIREEYK
jgi:hypothetical protein